MRIDFTGLHVVVTGGTGSLGAAVVELLVAAGATCHVPAHRPANPSEFPLASHERVRVTPGIDLTDESAVSSFYTALPSLWASVHSAGAFTMAPIAETSLSDFRKMIDTNATTCFLCSREAVKKIRASRNSNGGRLVNVAARPALVPTPGLAAYAASKSAVVALTQSLSEELAPERIWVNAVAPSIMDTPINREMMPKADHSTWPSVADVAATIAFLASPQNAVTRGSIAPVYGRA
jgi:NAD(P)-dependent dehydrogenase (short-subunit alcohol dehydrogenase family)